MLKQGQSTWFGRMSGAGLLLITWVLVACQPIQPRPADTAATPTPTVPATVQPSPPTTPMTILPTPAAVRPVAERQLAAIEIAYPDELLWLHDSLWVKTDRGHVVQVDPTTHQVISDVKIDTTPDPYHYCMGLGTDGENLWVCSASGEEESETIDVVRFATSPPGVIATVAVDKIWDQHTLPFLDNQIWVLAGRGEQLIGIDVTTNQPNPAIDLGARCFQLAVVEQMLVATCQLDNLLLRIDPAQRRVVEQVTLPDPRLIDANAAGVWVVQENAVVRLDRQSLQPVATWTGLPGVGGEGDIAVTAEAVWIRQPSGFLYRIDPATNAIVEQIQLAEPLSGGSVLATADSVWTTAYDDDLLLRLSIK